MRVLASFILIIFYITEAAIPVQTFLLNRRMPFLVMRGLMKTNRMKWEHLSALHEI